MRFLLLAAVFFAISVLPYGAYAQIASENYEAKRFEYHDPNMKNISKLYWTMGRMDINNNEHIDNFIRINECDIFRDYFKNEFEWQDVREATRVFLQRYAREFPLRFKFIQPLRLGEYNIEEESFDVLEDYRIDGTRRFELVSSDRHDDICGLDHSIPGYPRELVIEFSRPFEMRSLPLARQKAEQYIEQKLKPFKNIREHLHTLSNVHHFRDAYLLLKVKVFSDNGLVRSPTYGFVPGFLGVLEKIEVYADEELTDLLHERTFRQKIRVSEDMPLDPYIVKKLAVQERWAEQKAGQ